MVYYLFLLYLFVGVALLCPGSILCPILFASPILSLGSLCWLLSHVMTFRYIDTSKLPYGVDELMHIMATGLLRGGICCGRNRLGVLDDGCYLIAPCKLGLHALWSLSQSLVP